MKSDSSSWGVGVGWGVHPEARAAASLTEVRKGGGSEGERVPRGRWAARGGLGSNSSSYSLAQVCGGL